MTEKKSEALRNLSGLLISLTFILYALWQGPFQGKWAEGSFWLIMSVSVDLSVLDRRIFPK